MTSGLAIYDTLQYIKPEIQTICIGQAASMGALLLTAGTKGKRYALPHSRILIHQPMGGFQGQATDIEIHAREILRMRSELNQILQKHTGQPLERIEADTERDYFMSGEEAAEYGLIDKVISAGIFLADSTPKHTLRRNSWPWTTTESNGLPAKTESEGGIYGGQKRQFFIPVLFLLWEESG